MTARRVRIIGFAGVAAMLMLAVGTAEEDVYARIATYDFGDSRAMLASLEVRLREVGPAGHGEIEQGLLRVLQAPDATFAGKQFACGILRQIGSEQCVPVVARLLTDGELTHMARYTLEALPGDAAFDALLSAMRDTEGAVKVGLIGSLGTRRDERAVLALAELLSGADEDVSRAAMRSLGRIGGEQAAAALDRATVSEDLEGCRMDAYFASVRHIAESGNRPMAGKLYRVAYERSEAANVRTMALTGIVSVEEEKALPLLIELIEGEDADLARAARTLVIEIPGKGVGPRLAARLPSLAPAVQVAVLEVLSARPEAPGRFREVSALANSGDPGVRMAALACLGTVGNASSVDLLIDAIAEGEETGETARASLDRLRGADVNGRILARMQAADEALRVELIGSLAARRAVAAAPRIMDMASETKGAVRAAAIGAMGSLAGDDERPRMYALLRQSSGDRAVERAVFDAIIRHPDRDACIEEITESLADAEFPARSVMLRIVGRLGGEMALGVVSSAMNDENEDIRKLAAQTLSNWTDTDDLEAYISLARAAGDHPALRTALVRGGLRLVRAPSNRMPEETMALYRAIMEIPMELGEKRTLYETLGWLQHEDAMKIAIAGLDHAEWRDSAAGAVVRLANPLRRTHRALVKSGLEKVVASTTDDTLLKQAGDILDALK